MTHRTRLLALALLAPFPVLAQDAPPRRAHHGLAYDSVRARVVLSGGSTPHDGGRRFEFFDDLWEWDGARWHRVGAAGERLSGTTLVWDARRARLLSFGGYDGRGRDDIRVLAGPRWTPLGALASPSAEPGVVYDARRDRFVLFGGSAGPGRFTGETREWDGTAWRTLDVAGPSPRAAHTMAYDVRRGVVVLFGGMGASPRPGERPEALGDTWELDGARWTLKSTEGPLPRNGATAAYDAARGVVVLFGGAGGGGFQGDTWAWDGSRWRQLAVDGPEPRAMGQLAYDARRQRIVLFGGRTGWPDGDMGDTWEWDGRAWHKAFAAPPR